MHIPYCTFVAVSLVALGHISSLRSSKWNSIKELDNFLFWKFSFILSWFGSYWFIKFSELISNKCMLTDWPTRAASFAIHISLFLLHWKFLISKTCFSLIFPIISFRFWLKEQVFGKLENIIFRNFQQNTNTWQLHCSLMVIYCYATVPW